MITSIYINNFQGLKDFSFNPEMCVFLLASGETGSGKSACCKALSFLRDLAIGAGGIGDSARMYTSLLPSNGATTLCIEFLDNNNTYEYRLVFRYDWNKKEFVIEKEFVSCNKRIYANREENVATVWGAGSMPNTYALDRRTLLLSTASGIFVEDPIFVTKNFLSRLIVLAPASIIMRADNVYPENWLLMQDGSNLPNWSTWVYKHNANAKNLANLYIRRYLNNPGASIEMTNDCNGLPVLVLRRFNASSQAYDVLFSALSATEKLATFFSVLTAFRQIVSKSVFVIDDVWGAMQMQTRGKVVEDLRDTSNTNHQTLLFSTDESVNLANNDCVKFRFVRGNSPRRVS